MPGEARTASAMLRRPIDRPNSARGPRVIRHNSVGWPVHHYTHDRRASAFCAILHGGRSGDQRSPAGTRGPPTAKGRRYAETDHDGPGGRGSALVQPTTPITLPPPNRAMGSQRPMGAPISSATMLARQSDAARPSDNADQFGNRPSPMQPEGGADWLARSSSSAPALQRLTEPLPS